MACHLGSEVGIQDPHKHFTEGTIFPAPEKEM